MFDNEEEYVGVDDEHFYMAGQSAHPADNAHAFDNDPTHDSTDARTTNAFDDIGDIHHEEQVNDEDPQKIHVLHDPENPNIEVGVQLPNIVAFRKATKHHAVKVGFELARQKTDKTRFIAHCATKGCPWRIHASTIYDKKIVQV